MGSEKRVSLSLESLENRTLLSSYYLAPWGNDANPGTDAAPWATLQHAFASVNQGDSINLHEGWYDGGATLNTPSVTLQGVPGEGAHIASPNDNPDVWSALTLGLNSSGSVVRNLDLSGGYYYTLKTESNWDSGDAYEYGASNIVVEDSTLHDSGRDVVKVTPGSDNITMRRVEIYNSGMRDGSNAEGIDAVNADNFVLQDSYVHDIATDGVYVKGGSIGTVIERNRVDNIGWSGIILGQDSDYEWFDFNVNPEMYESIDGIARNNFVTNTQGAGIVARAALRAKIYNNTMVNVAQSMFSGIAVLGTEHYAPPDYTTPFNRPSKDVSIMNNVVVLGGSRPALEIRDGGLDGSITLSNNRYYAPNGQAIFSDVRSGYQAGLGDWMNYIGETGSSEGDPGVDSSGHLFSSSPVIDAGASTGDVSDDMDWQARFAGSAYDIGADEFNGTPTGGGGPVVGTPGVVEARYFSNASFQGNPLVRGEEKLGFTWADGTPDPSIAAGPFSAVFRAQFTVQNAEAYTFALRSAGGVRMWINGQRVVDNWGEHGLTTDTATLNLQPGETYRIRIRYYNTQGSPLLRLRWSSDSTPKQVIPAIAYLPPANSLLT